MRSLAARARLLLIFVAALAAMCSLLLLTGCRTVSPAELQDWGTRTYAGTTKAAAFKASFSAVRALGFDVASTDEGATRLRTAPKVVDVMASGNAYSAQVVSNSIAWDIDVSESAAGIVVHATPRGYTAGQSIPATKFSEGYAKKAFQTLFGEIEHDLGVAPPGASTTSAR